MLGSRGRKHVNKGISRRVQRGVQGGEGWIGGEEGGGGVEERGDLTKSQERGNLFI